MISGKVSSETARFRFHALSGAQGCFQNLGMSTMSETALLQDFGGSDGRKHGFLWSFGLFMALLLFALIAGIHFFHNCQLYGPAASQPSSSTSAAGDLGGKFRETPGPMPCLACIILHTLQTIQISFLLFAFAWDLLPGAAQTFQSKCILSRCRAFPFSGRAPPSLHLSV